MAPLYSVLFIIAALKNVPPLGFRTARQNGRLVFSRRPGVAVFTETWGESRRRRTRIKLGLRAAAPKTWRWHTAFAQSVMVGWDDTRYKLVWKKVVLGGGSPAIKGLSDRRDLFVVCLEDRVTGRRFVVVGVHTAPFRHGISDAVRELVAHAHAHAADNIEFIVGSTGYPVIVAGDDNTLGLVNAGHNPGNEIGNGIVHAELFPGDHSQFGAHPHASGFALHSDHLGVELELTATAA